MGESGELRIWDAGVRCFHWLLVAAVAVSAWSGFFAPLNMLDVHLVSGSVIAGLIGFRLIWGFLGSFHARFASFPFAPRTVRDYARDTLHHRARRYLGHNPLGALMVLALLTVLTLIVLTGLVALGGQDKQGPLAAFTTYATGSMIRSVHKALALLLVAMVLAHIGGVAFESRRERENLTLAMVTGRKRAEAGEPAPAGQGRAGLAAAVLLGGGAVSAVAVALLAALPALGVPTAPLDDDYARECAACHIAYHPSLLTAAGGAAIMDRLADHFGADASLSDALVAKIRAYLAANSAEHWDTLPAVMFRQTVDPADPRRITATGFWKRRHAAIPDAVFTAKPVYRRSNCVACHADAASGLFAPQAIEIPQ